MRVASRWFHRVLIMSKTNAFPLAAALVWAVPGLLALNLPLAAQGEARPTAEIQSPTEAVISAVRGDSVSLLIGTDDGARVGDLYEIQSGNTRARLRIDRVGATESSATLLNFEARGVVVVGESARFAGREVATPRATTALATPGTAVIQALAGQTATLAIGRQEGALVGAVYVLQQNGESKARLQIESVDETSATARLTLLDDNFSPTVGDTARFLEVAPLPPAPAPVSPPVAPPSQRPIQSLPANTSAELPRVVKTSLNSAVITRIDGETVTISSGVRGGAKVGQTIPVLRDGTVVALLRLTEVEPAVARGVVVWRDESQPEPSIGDVLGVLSPTTSADDDARPVTMVEFESGASNVSVPKNDRTYSLLASLASSGLITSQPPRVFHDDGARRHRTAEDIIFSRAQIAEFVREALSSGAERSGRDEAALAILIADYRSDLKDVGVAPELLTEAQRSLGQSNFRFGVSSFSRARLVGGDTDEDSIAPFAERFGAARLQSGFDSRLNVFGTVGSKLKFFGQLDTGTDLREGAIQGGTPPGGIVPDEPGNTTVRNAYVSYDASGLLRGLTINLGRKEYWWGPGTFGTTSLGDAPGGLDSVNVLYNRGRLQLEGLYARLGKGPAGSDRSLYGQNLSYRFGQNARLGFTTMMLAPNDALRGDLLAGALLPLPLYALDFDRIGQRGENTNAVLGAYAEMGVARGMRLYGELVLDDFSFTRTNRVENRNGGMLGVQLFDPRNPARAGLTIEYARLNSISYVIERDPPRSDADYDYYYRGAPFGYPIAPIFPTDFGGADSLRVDAHYSPQKRLTLFGSVEFSDLNSQDQNPAAPGDNGFSRQRVIRAAATYDLSRSWSLTGRAQRVETDQPNFVKGGPSVTTNSFSLEIGRSF